MACLDENNFYFARRSACGGQSFTECKLFGCPSNDPYAKCFFICVPTLNTGATVFIDSVSLLNSLLVKIKELQTKTKIV